MPCFDLAICCPPHHLLILLLSIIFIRNYYLCIFKLLFFKSFQNKCYEANPFSHSFCVDFF
jgi:hypothetical protein